MLSDLVGADRLTKSPRRWNCLRLIKLLESLVGSLNFAQTVIRVLACMKAFFSWQLTRALRCQSSCFQMPPEYLDMVDTTTALIQVGHNSAPIMSERLELQLAHCHGLPSDANGLGFGAWGRNDDGTIHAFGGKRSQLTNHEVVSHLNENSNNQEL